VDYLCLVEVLILVDRPCLVEVLVSCLEVVLLILVGHLVDRLVSFLEVVLLSLEVLSLVDLSFLVVGRLVLVVLFDLEVDLYFLLVVLPVSLPYFQFFSLVHQLSKLPQAPHHQLY